VTLNHRVGGSSPSQPTSRVRKTAFIWKLSTCINYELKQGE
jgi:hypothetical protein